MLIIDIGRANTTLLEYGKQSNELPKGCRSFKEFRDYYFKRFLEEDKEKGIPYHAKAAKVLENYRIIDSGNQQLEGDEVRYEDTKVTWPQTTGVQENLNDERVLYGSGEGETSDDDQVVYGGSGEVESSDDDRVLYGGEISFATTEVQVSTSGFNSNDASEDDHTGTNSVDDDDERVLYGGEVDFRSENKVQSSQTSAEDEGSDFDSDERVLYGGEVDFRTELDKQRKDELTSSITESVQPDEEADVIPQPRGTNTEQVGGTSSTKAESIIERIEEETRVDPQVEHTLAKEKISSNPSAYDVPKTLRDFIKAYPRCDVSFAEKYFSKGEIKKQVSLGKVYIKKGRLHI